MKGARAALLILLGLVLMSQEVNSRAGRGHNMGSVLLCFNAVPGVFYDWVGGPGPAQLPEDLVYIPEVVKRGVKGVR